MSFVFIVFTCVSGDGNEHKNHLSVDKETQIEVCRRPSEIIGGPPLRFQSQGYI